MKDKIHIFIKPKWFNRKEECIFLDLRRIVENPESVPNFSRISIADDCDSDHFLCVKEQPFIHKENFSRQVEELKEAGYRFMTLRELEETLNHYAE